MLLRHEVNMFIFWRACLKLNHASANHGRVLCQLFLADFVLFIHVNFFRSKLIYILLSCRRFFPGAMKADRMTLFR
jgi:uncharacterized membrane protein YqaE (UPF0057 family)